MQFSGSDKTTAQSNVSPLSAPSRIGKSRNSSIEKPKAEQPKTDKPKNEVNGTKQATADIAQKPKIKMFGEDYVEAPLPTVNPWKRPNSTSLAATVSEQFPAAAAIVLTNRVQPSAFLRGELCLFVVGGTCLCVCLWLDACSLVLLCFISYIFMSNSAYMFMISYVQGSYDGIVQSCLSLLSHRICSSFSHFPQHIPEILFAFEKY